MEMAKARMLNSIVQRSLLKIYRTNISRILEDGSVSNLFKIFYRRLFLVCLLVLGFTIILSNCDWFVDKPISIASHVWVGYEPMFIADREHWLDAKQVHLIETSSVAASLKALAEGKVQGAALTLDEMLKARAQGLPLTAVLIFDISAGADMLVVNPSIKKLSDLKGRRIGFEKSSVGELLLVSVLEAAKLTKQDVVLVPLSVDKHGDAWRNKQVDAVISYEPVASQLLAQGAVKLLDSRQIPNKIIDVLAIRNDMLDQSHASAIRNLIAAHLRALEYLNHNPQDASYRTASHLRFPAEGVMIAFKGLLLLDTASNYQWLAGSSSRLLDTAYKLSAIMVKSGLLKQKDTMSSLISADFLPSDFQNN